MYALRIAVAVGLVAVVAACGSDSKEAAVSTESVTTEAVATADSAPRPEGSLPEPDDATSPDGAEAPTDFLAEVLFAPEVVDDEPVCQSFANFFNRFAQLTFSGAFAGLDDPATDDQLTTEQLELMLFLGVDDDIARLESSFPGAVLSAYESTFARINAVRRLMSDAGFSDTELDAIQGEVASGSPAESGSVADDPRLLAAATAMVDEFGTYLSSLDQLDTLTVEGEAEADTWLQGQCPELFVAFDSQ